MGRTPKKVPFKGIPTNTPLISAIFKKVPTKSGDDAFLVLGGKPDKPIRKRKKKAPFQSTLITKYLSRDPQITSTGVQNDMSVASDTSPNLTSIVPDKTLSASSSSASSQLTLDVGNQSSTTSSVVMTKKEPFQVPNHPRYGRQLFANNLTLHNYRIQLLDWLVSVEQDPTLKNDNELKRLTDRAQFLKKTKYPIQFTMTPIMRQRKGYKPIIGYYIVSGAGMSLLTDFACTAWKLSIRRVAISDQKRQQLKIAKCREERMGVPPLEIVYMAGFFFPSVKSGSVTQTITNLLVPSPLKANSEIKLYPGQTNGNERGNLECRRSIPQSFKLFPEEFYKYSNRPAEKDRACFAHVFSRMVDSVNTKDMAEGFFMAYAQRHNKIHGDELFLVTYGPAIPFDLLEKAVEYADNGTPLFEIVAANDQRILGKNRYCSLEDMTSLPIRISEEEPIMLFDPEDPKFKPLLPRVKDVHQLLTLFPNPPESFLCDKPVLQAEVNKILTNVN